MFSIRYVFRIFFSNSLRCRLNSSCRRSIALCSLSACPMRQPITVRVRVSDSSARVLAADPLRAQHPQRLGAVLMGTQIQESGPSPDDFPCTRVLSRNDGSTRTSAGRWGCPSSSSSRRSLAPDVPRPLLAAPRCSRRRPPSGSRASSRRGGRWRCGRIRGSSGGCAGRSPARGRGSASSEDLGHSWMAAISAFGDRESVTTRL